MSPELKVILKIKYDFCLLNLEKTNIFSLGIILM